MSSKEKKYKCLECEEEKTIGQLFGGSNFCYDCVNLSSPYDFSESDGYLVARVMQLEYDMKKLKEKLKIE